MKQCTKCEEIKDSTKFGKAKHHKDGLTSQCRMCINKRLRDYYNGSEYRRKHVKELMAKKYRENPERIGRRNREWVKNNREKVREIQRNWREANPDKQKATAKKTKQKRFLLAKNRINRSISEGVRSCLRKSKAGRKWESIVGYTVNELKRHLESLFTQGMTWSNYGEWHIDHIIPQSFFKFESDEDVEFKMCWRLENLQPLWARENIQKGNKIAV